MILRFIKRALPLFGVVTLFVVLVVFWLMRPIPFAVRAESSFLVAPEYLREHVKLLSTTYSPRLWDNASSNRQILSYMKQNFITHKAQVTEQRFKVGDTEQVNLIAKYGGSSGPLYVVGAHYDSARETPGADDNASGVAGLLELGKLLSRYPLPDIQVELVAFATEEPPHFNTENMGSAHYVQSLRKDGITPAFAIVLEMIGYFTDEPNSQNYPHPFMKLFYPDVGNYIAVVGDFSLLSPTCQVKYSFMRRVQLPVYSLNGPSIIPGVDYSDHREFWEANIPAVMVTDTAFLRNTNYHTPEDSWETLDYSKMSEVVGGVYGVLADMNG